LDFRFLIAGAFMTTEAEMKVRTKQFSLRAIDLAVALPNTALGNIIQKQLIRACTSVGSNYRAACRSKSTADFIYKLSIVDEEADECMFWMEVIMDKNLQPEKMVQPLYLEANEIISIVVASIKTAKGRNS
jgi:four helix bundle protein